ncbi:MAG: spermidine synthase, partial [Gemmatimonadetes bacterium]|nr:spermidine synthase [Gemmatimonadota bacterium]
MAEPSAPDTTYNSAKSFLLLAAIFSASACAIVYELLIGSTSAYFLGDSVEQFSITIGLFLASMGLGAWISRAVVDQLLERFIALELWLAAIGGFSVP